MSATDASARRLRLIEAILQLPEARLAEVERPLAGGPSAAPSGRDWPHAPLHRISEQGTYIVTAGTYQQSHIFRGADRLDHLEAELLAGAQAGGWQLEAWAVFSNHYHFVGHVRPDSRNLSDWLAEMHCRTSCHVNQLDGCPGRQVWFNYWDTALTFEKSYLARLNYVHQNPVKHGLVRVANQYRWCSAPWLERTATPAQVATVYSFKTDCLKIEDDFSPVL
jgi:putative transposase